MAARAWLTASIMAVVMFVMGAMFKGLLVVTESKSFGRWCSR